MDEKFFDYVTPDEDGVIHLEHFEQPVCEISSYARHVFATSGDLIGTLAEYLERNRQEVETVVLRYFEWMVEQLVAGYTLRFADQDDQSVFIHINRDTACYRQVFGRLPAEMALVEIRRGNHRKTVPDHLRICPLGGDYLVWDEED